MPPASEAGLIARIVRRSALIGLCISLPQFPRTPDYATHSPPAAYLLNMEKVQQYPEDMEGSNGTSRVEGLERIRTAQSVNISAELFEKLYLNPPNRVHGDLRKTFANPTPLYVVSCNPLHVLDSLVSSRS